jgi:hypothetical protein
MQVHLHLSGKRIQATALLITSYAERIPEDQMVWYHPVNLGNIGVEL